MGEMMSDDATRKRKIKRLESVLRDVSEAYEEYKKALEMREHGGVAAHRCVDRIGFALSQIHPINH